LIPNIPEKEEEGVEPADIIIRFGLKRIYVLIKTLLNVSV